MGELEHSEETRSSCEDKNQDCSNCSSFDTMPSLPRFYLNVEIVLELVLADRSASLV